MILADYNPDDPNDVGYYALQPAADNAALYFTFLNSFYEGDKRSMHDIHLDFTKIEMHKAEPPLPDDLFNLCFKYGINDQMSQEDWDRVMEYLNAKR